MDDDRVLRILLCIVGIVFILMGFIDFWIDYVSNNIGIILKMLLKN